jgi:hypothetical protein
MRRIISFITQINKLVIQRYDLSETLQVELKGGGRVVGEPLVPLHVKEKIEFI